jgi:hypothetical protein
MKKSDRVKACIVLTLASEWLHCGVQGVVRMNTMKTNIADQQQEH